MSTRNETRLPPVCYIAHPTTSATVAIQRGENGYRVDEPLCPPVCLNSRLSHSPNEDDIGAMRHVSLIGCDTPGADPAFWRIWREGRCE